MAFNNLSNAMSPPPPTALPVPSTAIVTVLPSNAMSAPPVTPTAIITVPPSAHHLPPFLCHPPLCCLMKCPHQRPLLYLCHRPSRLPCHQSQPLTNLLPVPSQNKHLMISIPSGPVTWPLLFSKKSRLENFINKIAKNIDYENKFNSCVISHQKKKLKEKCREAVSYMRECFGTLLDDQHFLKWL